MTRLAEIKARAAAMEAAIIAYCNACIRDSCTFGDCDCELLAEHLRIEDERVQAEEAAEEEAEEKAEEEAEEAAEEAAEVERFREFRKELACAAVQNDLRPVKDLEDEVARLQDGLASLALGANRFKERVAYLEEVLRVRNQAHSAETCSAETCSAETCKLVAERDEARTEVKRLREELEAREAEATALKAALWASAKALRVAEYSFAVGGSSTSSDKGE
jgi:fused signal recognition particle receptor